MTAAVPLCVAGDEQLAVWLHPDERLPLVRTAPPLPSPPVLREASTPHFSPVSGYFSYILA